MDFLKLTGPEFLEFYWKAFFGVVAIAVLLPFFIRFPFDLPPSISAAAHTLHPFDIAYLKGGKVGAIKAALVSLWHRGLVRVRTGLKSLERTAAPAQEGLHPLEQAVCDELDNTSKPRELMKAPLPHIAFSIKALRDQQLIMSTAQRFLCGIIRIGPPALLMLIGIVRFARGAVLGRPVGYLFGWLLVTGILLLLCIFSLPRRTRRGDKVLELLSREYTALKTANARDRNGSAPAELAMGMALFGLAAVPTSSGLQEVFRPDPAISSSSGGCGSSGCGGGGCGGGCGGGGCGG